MVAFIRDHGIPHNRLHDRGFLSIGCASRLVQAILGRGRALEGKRADKPLKQRSHNAGRGRLNLLCRKIPLPDALLDNRLKKARELRSFRNPSRRTTVKGA